MQCVFASLFVFFLSFASFAQGGELALILSDDSKPYTEFANTLSKQLDSSAWKITRGTPNRDLNPTLIVTAGNEALRDALKLPQSAPILATLIAHNSYDEILAEAGQNKKRTSAIFLDQPAERQARFLRELLPQQLTIGMLFSPQTANLQSAFEQALKNNGRSLLVENIESPGGPLSALNNLLRQADVLLAIPDNAIYKRDTVKPILVTGFRYLRPIVAFSPAFVTAGAIGAIYSTPAQIASQAATAILSRGINLASPTDPAQFSIAINPTVANSLGLSLPSESDIRRGMLKGGERK